jgi:hypothetical protein
MKNYTLCPDMKSSCGESGHDVESPRSLYDELHIGEVFGNNIILQKWFVYKGCRASTLPEILRKIKLTI